MKKTNKFMEEANRAVVAIGNLTDEFPNDVLITALANRIAILIAGAKVTKELEGDLDPWDPQQWTIDAINRQVAAYVTEFRKMANK